MNIYPNPVRNHLFIGIEEEVHGSLTIEITDKAGKPVFRETWMNAGETIQINLEQLNMQAGFYFVKVKQEGFALKTLRVFKQ